MITYKKFSVFLLVGVLILSSGFFNAKTAQAAALAPTSVVYLDTNSNGQVDTVRISFTDVTACTYEAGDWAVGIAGTIGVTAVTGIVNLATCATSDEFIDVSVTASAGITGGATNPRIDYTDAVTAGNVVADGNQDAANFTAVDAAGPAIVSAVTLGPNNFQINFSEAILESSLADGDLEYQNTASGGDSAITDANVDPDTDALFFVVTNTATFAVDETTGEVHFSAAGVISDIPGNTNTQTADVTITDGIAPEVLSAVTADIDSNGQIDTLVVAYTENVDDPNYDAVEVDGYVLLGTGTDSGTDILFYDLTESGTADTGATPALNWTPANAEDLNGNILDDFTFPFPTTATDQALPVLLSAVYDDLDSDGMVDTILTVWSEDVIMNGSTAADWTITGGSINAVFGSVADDGVPDTILGITVTANAGETGGAVNPTIAYDNGDANDSVRDVPSNFAGTNVAVSASDGADPVVTITVSEPLISITDDGNAFDVIFTFSEIMDSTTFPTVGFSENVIGSGVLESATCTDNWSTDVVTDDT